MVALQDIPALPQLTCICREFHVRRLWLFGSSARGEAQADSDIDLLVEFEAGHTPGYFRFGELADRLGDLLGPGRRIDLVTEPALHELIRPHVMDERILIYEG